MKIHLLLIAISIRITSQYQKRVLMPGDVILGGLFGVQSYGTAPCNQVDPESVQIYEAVRWFFQQLNSRNYIPNVKLGLDAFNTCDEPADAMQATLDMLELHKDKKLYGVLGPGRSSETQDVSRLLSSLPEASRLPQLSYSATAATLSDRDTYKNLYRVIVPDNMQIEVLHQLLLELKWNYIAIVYETDTYGTGGATALRTLAENSDICVPIYFGIPAEDNANARRTTFTKLKNQLEKESQSPVTGLVFFGLGSTAKVMFEYLSLELQNFQVIASEAIGLNTEYAQSNLGQTFKRAKGLITLSPPIYDPLLFKEYWRLLHTNETALLQTTSDNEWLLRYMEHVTGCQLENQTDVQPTCLATASVSEDIHMSIYISYALTAVAAFAKTVRDVYVKKCPDMGGVCTAMRDMKKVELIQKMGSIEVNSGIEFSELLTFNRTFSFNNGEIEYKTTDITQPAPTYGVYNFQQCDSGFCFKKVGYHIGGQLSVNRTLVKSYNQYGDVLASTLEAQCEPGYDCSYCKDDLTKSEVIYLPGDYYVIGLAPLHDRDSNPLVCGPLRTTVGVDLAEAIIYSVKRANLKKDRFVSFLGTKKIGLVMIDTCNSPLIMKERVLKLHKGELRLAIDVNSSVMVDKIIGYIGPYSSSLSVPLSSVMTELDKLFISYASTSSSLSSRTLHPNFMRTCSPDYKQANIIMYLASQLKSEYVQIIHTDEEYGIAGSIALQESAQRYKVCVAQVLAVPDVKVESQFLRYVSELRRYPHAKTVIIFVRSHITALLMKALNRDIDNDEFIFIGGESWGKRSQLLEGNTKTIGSLTIAQELPKNQGFEDYFGDLNVQETENPWIQEYLETKAGCYYAKSFNKASGTLCTKSMIAQVHQTDPWVPFAINGAYALMLGFGRALSSKCFGSESICNDLTTSDIIQQVREVRLDIYNDDVDVRVFDENGEGNVGYIVSQIIKDGQQLRYNKVGSSVEDITELTLSQLVDVSAFVSMCQNELECGRCRLQFNETIKSENTGSDNSSSVVGLGVFVAILLIVIIVLIVVGAIWWRRSKSRPPSNGDVKYNTGATQSPGIYITPVTDTSHYSELENNSAGSRGYISQDSRASGGYCSPQISGGQLSQNSAGYVSVMDGRSNPGISLENDLDSGSRLSSTEKS